VLFDALAAPLVFDRAESQHGFFSFRLTPKENGAPGSTRKRR
jgi:hypothetical protein